MWGWKRGHWWNNFWGVSGPITQKWRMLIGSYVNNPSLVDDKKNSLKLSGRLEKIHWGSGAWGYWNSRNIHSPLSWDCWGSVRPCDHQDFSGMYPVLGCFSFIWFPSWQQSCLHVQGRDLGFIHGFPISITSRTQNLISPGELIPSTCLSWCPPSPYMTLPHLPCLLHLILWDFTCSRSAPLNLLFLLPSFSQRPHLNCQSSERLSLTPVLP